VGADPATLNPVALGAKIGTVGRGMNPETWTAVDRYFVEALSPSDPVLDAALAANVTGGLPAIDVSPMQGRLLHLLALTQGAKRILEIGTLGGYSSIWLARALPPGGRMITLEFEPKHARVARENLDRAGFKAVVEILTGRAIDLLPGLGGAGAEPFDVVFIDADKASTPDYFAWALKLTRPGSLIIVDNVVRGGEVANAETTDANVLGMRRFMAALAQEPRVKATAIQTVGSKGYDGFVLARVV
jgi:predicted O-methyltransferase YrrM